MLKHLFVLYPLKFLTKSILYLYLFKLNYTQANYPDFNQITKNSPPPQHTLSSSSSNSCQQQITLILDNQTNQACASFENNSDLSSLSRSTRTPKNERDKNRNRKGKSKSSRDNSHEKREKRSLRWCTFFVVWKMD